MSDTPTSENPEEWSEEEKQKYLEDQEDFAWEDSELAQTDVPAAEGEGTESEGQEYA